VLQLWCFIYLPDKHFQFVPFHKRAEVWGLWQKKTLKLKPDDIFWITSVLLSEMFKHDTTRYFLKYNITALSNNNLPLHFKRKIPLFSRQSVLRKAGYHLLVPFKLIKTLQLECKFIILWLNLTQKIRQFSISSTVLAFQKDSTLYACSQFILNRRVVTLSPSQLISPKSHIQ